jgi:D-ribose pyranose/furanose isomerase RbsD
MEEQGEVVSVKLVQNKRESNITDQNMKEDLSRTLSNCSIVFANRIRDITNTWDTIYLAFEKGKDKEIEQLKSLMQMLRSEDKNDETLFIKEVYEAKEKKEKEIKEILNEKLRNPKTSIYIDGDGAYIITMSEEEFKELEKQLASLSRKIIILEDISSHLKGITPS